ncbi:MAG: endonuclease domain-containing protein [bacterium]
MVYVQRTKEFLLHLNAKETTFNRALLLRKKMTEAEKMIWGEIKNRKFMKLKFRRQHPIHLYIADFYCHEKRLIIEIDGGIHNSVEIKENDQNRSAELDRSGVSVVRFSNEKIMNNLSEVLLELKVYIEKITSDISHSPSGEGAGGEVLQCLRHGDSSLCGR